jgi:hypothetical protein
MQVAVIAVVAVVAAAHVETAEMHVLVLVVGLRLYHPYLLLVVVVVSIVVVLRPFP